MAEKRAFECFGRLPEYLRTKIYEYACSVSRIVDVQEIFLNPDFPSYYPPYIATHFRGGRECAVISETRPPAILNVSKEARAYTLTKYTAIDEKILSKKGDEEVNKSPVYVNSDVDIVYRGKGPCSTSHAFAMKHECLEDFLVPVAFSKVLAVDIYGIIPHDMAWLERFYRKRGYDEKTAKLMPELEYYEERGWEIAYLARKGVTEIIIILDNDDNMTDFELCDLQSNEQSWTPREKGAYLELERLKRQIHCAWSGFEDEDPELIEGLSIPKITVKKLKRAPLRLFHQFTKLPLELQNMIWRYSVSVPRVHSITSSNHCLNLRTFRAPPLLFVCRATRSMMQNLLDRQFKPLPYKEAFRMGDYPYYNPSLDTVRLELADDDKLRDLASIDFEIRSMGIPFHLIDGEVWRAIGADIRHFHSLREIVFVLGRTRANCEMELVYVDENSPEVTQRYPHNPNGRAGVREFVRAFKAELASRHKKWELNQCRRADKSKSTKHWNLPEVKVAFLKALCTSTSPYSYVNRFPERADFPEELPWGDIH